MAGVTDNVEANAGTRYESAALGPTAIDGEEWAQRVARGLDRVISIIDNIKYTNFGFFRSWMVELWPKA